MASPKGKVWSPEGQHLQKEEKDQRMYTQVLEEPFAVGHTSRHRVQENLGDTQYNSITKEEKRGDF